MAFDGSGNFNRKQNWVADATAGIKIKSDRHDDEDNNFASGLSNTICKDGQSQIVADIPWNGMKILNLAPGILPTDAVNLGQVQAYNGTVNANPAGIVISGSTPTSRLTYTGTTGPWGQSYTVADMSSGVSGTSWVWNDKADFSGTDLMKLDKTTVLTLASKDAGAGTGPSLTLLRDSPSPADSDNLGIINWNGKNSAAAVVTYGRLYVQALDVTSATEDSTMALQIRKAGALTSALSLTTAGGTLSGDLTVTSDLSVASTLSVGTHIALTGTLNSASNTNVYIKGNHQCKNGISVAGGTYSADSFNMLYSGGMHLFVNNSDLGIVSTASDYRIKKDVADLPSTWDRVKALHPISYTHAEFYSTHSEETKAAADVPDTLITADDDIERWGFIAHETQEALLPTAASGEKDMVDGVQALNLAPILAATVKALQEAMLRIEALEAAATP